MSLTSGIWAVVPVKETEGAKERRAGVVPAARRQAWALAMIEDVLAALTAAQGLAGIALVTLDPHAMQLAAQYGAKCIEDGARDGHTGSVTAAARQLKARGAGGILQVPGDIPLITAGEIEALLAAHKPAPSFTIAPSHDEIGIALDIDNPADLAHFSR